MFHPRLSIVTIVFNNVLHIERTLESVIRQTYPHIEYIVIDGGSTDGTMDLIRKYTDRITHLVNEKDRGIYDAMNKGLALATGDYILFMNSGDELYDPKTVANVFASAPDADMYYGETEMIDENGTSLGQRRHAAPDAFTWRSFRYGMCISHQAIYIRRSITAPYNLTYELSADIDWIIRAAKKAKKIVNTRQYVAKYLVGGMSKKRHWQSLKERFRIFTKYYGLVPNLLNHVVIIWNLTFYYLRHKRTND